VLQGIAATVDEYACQIVSFGGGVQSTALLVLAAQGKIPYRTFLFANVGDDSESPGTLRYVRSVAQPFAVAHGLELQELRRYRLRGKHAGEPVTLWQQLVNPQSRTIGIPVRMMPSGAPGQRRCTVDFKIRVIYRELRRRGATRERPALVALGISLDEIQRAKPGRDPRLPAQVRTYPLLDLGLDRAACIRLIQNAGLPVPPKSSCFFCPYHDMAAWQQLAQQHPSLFEKACWLEDVLRERAKRLGRGDIWLTSAKRPLREVVFMDQLPFPGIGDDCDSGYCFS
jgi:PP-loop superfamily ATP-utilizing enzyme